MTAPGELPAPAPLMQPVQPVGVVVTFDAIYAKLLDVDRSVTRMSDQFADVPTRLQLVESTVTPLADLPSRVAALEVARWKLAGVAAAGSLIFGTLGATIFNHVLVK